MSTPAAFPLIGLALGTVLIWLGLRIFDFDARSVWRAVLAIGFGCLAGMLYWRAVRARDHKVSNQTQQRHGVRNMRREYEHLVDELRVVSDEIFLAVESLLRVERQIVAGTMKAAALETFAGDTVSRLRKTEDWIKRLERLPIGGKVSDRLATSHQALVVALAHLARALASERQATAEAMATLNRLRIGSQGWKQTLQDLADFSAEPEALVVRRACVAVAQALESEWEESPLLLRTIG